MTETKYTFCHICEVSCGLKVSVENNRIKKIEPDRKHVVTKGFACPKGLGYASIQHSPDRILHPRRRDAARWTNLSWKQALTEIGDKTRSLIDQYGPDSIAFYSGYGPAYNFAGSMMMTAFVDGIGSKNSYSAGSQDCNNKFLVHRHMYGSGFRISYPDLVNTQVFIIIGANPAVSKMTFNQAPRIVQTLRRIEERGGRVMFIDPRRTETARAVGEHQFIRPNTDVFFLLAFLNELINSGGVDHKKVAQYMSGFEILKEICAPWSLKKAAAVTGLSVKAIRDMVNAYREARGASIYCSTGVNMGTHATLAYWISEAINALSGNADRLGGTIFGEGLFADMAKILKKQGRMERTDRSRVSSLPSVNDEFPCAALAEEILTPGQRQIRALFVYGGNPLLTCANPNGRMEKAFRSLELLVCIDPFQNETGDLAHYILPTTTYMERPDLPMILHWMAGVQPTRYVQYIEPVLTPPDNVREECWIFPKLALAAGLPLFGQNALTWIFKLLDRLESLPIIGDRLTLTSKHILSLPLLMTRGVASRKKQIKDYPHGQLLAPNQPGTFLGKRLLTDDGLLHLAPKPFVSAAETLEADYRTALAERNRLKLITKREPLTHNSWLHNFEAYMGPKRKTNYLYLNPADAGARGLAEGDMAEIASAAGKVTIPVKLTDDLMPGVVAFPHGWGHKKAQGLSIARKHPGVNANFLTADGPEGCEKLSGMAHMTGIIVDVRKVKARREKK